MTLVSLKLCYKPLQITLNCFLVIFLLLILFNAASLASTPSPEEEKKEKEGGYIAEIRLHCRRVQFACLGDHVVGAQR